MQFTSKYQSPVGEILLACDQIGLTGLWFKGEKYYALGLETEHMEKGTPIFEKTKQWLDIYFTGKNPNFMPPIHMIGTPFQLSVWQVLSNIPYGKTTTYGNIAKQIASEKGLAHM